MNEVIKRFEEYNWHDSIVFKIEINRENSINEIIISLYLILDWKKWEFKKSILKFKNCWKIEMDYAFQRLYFTGCNIEGKEILRQGEEIWEAGCLENSKMLTDFLSHSYDFYPEKPKNPLHFYILFNSKKNYKLPGNSRIVNVSPEDLQVLNIIAEDFSVEYLKEETSP